jgi:molybdopterin-dependent oxidoreductase alpha subunit
MARDPSPDIHASRKAAAGGLPAVTSSLRHLREEDALGRGLKALRVMNQEHGIDCPGCAWPDPADRSHFEFCENGAKAIAAETTTRRADPEFFSRYSVEELLERDDHWLEKQGRVTEPVIRRRGSRRFETISWEEAFARTAQALRTLEHPDRAAFYTSGRTSNEAAFLFQLMVRRLGTNNLPDCSNLCHESSGFGLKRTIGLGKGTVQLEDFEKADAIFVVGQNPGTNHPRMLLTLQEARRRGAEIVCINPLRETGLEAFINPQEPLATLRGRATPLATLYLQPKVGSDVAVLAGIMKHVLDEERLAPGRILDHSFIRTHTLGFDDLREDLARTPWSAIVEQTGLREEEIRAAGDVYVRSGATILCWAMGLTQHENAVDNVIACSNLLLLRGNIGRSGAGPCPIRGHSNVQGDRTVGITTRPAPEFLDRLGRAFGFVPPREEGLDVVAAIGAMEEGRIHFFMAMGGNFHSASPDTERTALALSGIPFTVHVTTKLNRTHLVAGQETLILPCLGRTETDVQAGGEQFVTVEDSMSCVHLSRGRLEPASPQLRSEPAIVAGIARALWPEQEAHWAEMAGDYDRIRDRIAQVLPAFERYNERVREPAGFVLPHPAASRVWDTESGKAAFETVPLPDIRLAEGELRLFTIRSHDQYNTTIYGMDDRYRGIRGTRRVVFVHAADLDERGLEDGALVDLVNAAGGRERVAPSFRVVAYDVPRGCAAAYFPETNVLVPLESVARGSRTPSSKMVPVTLRPAAPLPEGAREVAGAAGSGA